VTAGIVDSGPCRDRQCKLPWGKTFRFTKRQQVSYTPARPRVKKKVAVPYPEVLDHHCANLKIRFLYCYRNIQSRKTVDVQPGPQNYKDCCNDY